jgi:drug/metabolite transporter (DMT)-like permease
MDRPGAAPDAPRAVSGVSMAAAPIARRRELVVGGSCAALAMAAVGSSFAVAEELVAYPAAGGQAARYALAGLILLAVLRGRLVRPTRRELVLLTALAATGLALFNALVIAAVEAADAGSVGVVVACVPVVLAVAAPLLARRALDPRVLLGAVVVAAGAAVVQGLGGVLPPRALVLALGALACEAAFSLLAAPLLDRLGAVAVSAWAALLAVPLLVASALVLDGPAAAFPVPTAREVAALAYLAVVVTALAFVVWYTAVHRLGAERAGLFSAVLPVSALLTAAALGESELTTGRLLGVLAVAAGIALALRRRNGVTAS